MSEIQYLAAIGKRGGLVSRRELTKSHARQMVAIREMKRAAIKGRKTMATAQSQIVKAYLSESGRCFIYRKRLTMNERCGAAKTQARGREQPDSP